MTEDPHGEAALCDPRDGASDIAHADDADRSAGNLACLFGMRAAGEPALPSQIRVDHAKPAGQGEARKHDMFGDRRGIGARHIGDEHARGGGGFEGNHVEPGSVSDRSAKAPLTSEKLGWNIGAHDDDIGLRPLAGERRRIECRSHLKCACRGEPGLGLGMQRMGRIDVMGHFDIK